MSNCIGKIYKNYQTVQIIIRYKKDSIKSSIFITAEISKQIYDTADKADASDL